MFRIGVLLLVALTGIAGCSSGGGGDECNDSVGCIQPDPATIVDSTDILGAYDIRYHISSNSCIGAAPLQQLHEEYEVTSGVGYHGYPTVEVSSNTGFNYSTNSSTDNTDGKNYASNLIEIGGQELANFVSDMNCSESISLSFSDVGQSKVVVTRLSEINCESAGPSSAQGSSMNCQVVYIGEGTFSPQR